MRWLLFVVRKAALFNISMQTRAWIMRCIYEGWWRRGFGIGGAGPAGLIGAVQLWKEWASFSHDQPDTKQPLSPPGSCHTANIYIQRKKKNISKLCKLTSCLTRPRERERERERDRRSCGSCTSFCLSVSYIKLHLRLYWDVYLHCKMFCIA